MDTKKAVAVQRRSRVRCPAGRWPTVLDFLVERFPAQGRDTWVARMQAGLVCDESGAALDPHAAYVYGRLLSYFRQVDDEAPAAGEVRIVYQDAHLLIADKPHFMPVTPSGQVVNGALLNVLTAVTGELALQPLHRIDSDTAGLVAFGICQQDRAAYHALFSQRRIRKSYLAITQIPNNPVPAERISRIEPDPAHFMRMHEVDGPPNAHTRIALMQEMHGFALWKLEPITGKRHQLRVHMNALGLPLCNDGIYPVLTPTRQPHAAWPEPLQLLAAELEFIDPITGCSRSFATRQRLKLSMATSPHDNIAN